MKSLYLCSVLLREKDEDRIVIQPKYVLADSHQDLEKMMLMELGSPYKNKVDKVEVVYIQLSKAAPSYYPTVPTWSNLTTTNTPYTLRNAADTAYSYGITAGPVLTAATIN